MPISPELLLERIAAATQPGVRRRLLDRGLARGMIWNRGTLPEGAPPLGGSLTEDLLDHGYAVLAQTLLLLRKSGRSAVTDRGFRFSAECIEAAVRRGPNSTERHFHLVTAATAFHLAHYSARSFCLVQPQGNYSAVEQGLIHLVRRSIGDFRDYCRSFLTDPSRSPQGIATRFAEEVNGEGEFDVLGEAVATALSRPILRALALTEFALETGEERYISSARRLLRHSAGLAAEAAIASIWWPAELAAELSLDLWQHSLHELLPLDSGGSEEEDLQWKRLRKRFIKLLFARQPSHIDLWPSQVEAARRCVDQGDDLIVALPTSAGKTRIAELAILRCLASGRRVIYVTPLRALSAQLEDTLAQTFRPLGFRVSSLYGASGMAVTDIDALRATSIVVATPEKLDFSIRQDPGILDDVGLVVLDEGHMIGEGEREIRYEVLVQRLLKRPDADTRRIICLSAVFASGDAFDDFTAWIRADEPGAAILSDWRPTRQRTATLQWDPDAGEGILRLRVDEENPFVPAFLKAEAPNGRRKNPFPQNPPELTWATASRLRAEGHRVLVYCPQRSSVESLGALALTLARQGHLESMLAVEADLGRAREIGREWLGSGHVAVECLDLGVGLHHGLLPRPFLREIEELARRGELPVVIASPTVAQGLELSGSALVFHSLHRSGEILDAKEFANVIGRVGRAFVDLDGLAVLPVFGTGRDVRWRVAAFAGLQAQMGERDLESGLVLLIETLISKLARLLEISQSDLSEYVLNQADPWSSAVALAEGEKGESDGSAALQRDLLATLEDLDTALLGTIEDLDGDAIILADALDSALRSSLWARRLARGSEGQRELQRSLLLSRSEWLWERTTAAQRRGFYWAGLGYRAGRHITEHQGELLENLLDAERRLQEGGIDGAVDALVEFAERMFEVSPFRPHRLPDVPHWRELLRSWVRGQATSQFATTASDFRFLYDAVVYRLVWAVEAVRVLALADGNDDAELLSGSTAMFLTHGVPIPSAAVLLQIGFPSRRLALRLTEDYAADFTDVEGLGFWVEQVRSTPDIEAGLESDAESSAWASFIRSWDERLEGTWRQTRPRVPVSWQVSRPPADGTRVRVLKPVGEGLPEVLAPDMSRLGELTEVPEMMGRGFSEARVSDGSSRITIEFFGPQV